MIYVCSLYREEEGTIIGRGSSAEEAKDKCLQELSGYLDVEVEFEEGVTIPLAEAERIPSPLPSGCQLVVFERSSHCHGGSYDWRFFAIPFGYYTIDKGRDIEVTDHCPVVVRTVDSNSDVTYPLPEGSVEYVDGRWLPSFGVEYGY